VTEKLESNGGGAEKRRSTRIQRLDHRPGNRRARPAVPGNLSGRASALLAQIQAEAAGLKRNAETLVTFASNLQYSWQSHANYLDRVKGHINAVGDTHCRAAVRPTRAIGSSV